MASRSKRSARKTRAARKPFLALAFLAASCAGLPEFDETEQWPPPRRGMVVSEHPLATEAGVGILAKGGNAVDAAIATALALAVVYPQAGNLGGGGFAVWVAHDPEEAPLCLDFRETAPAGLNTAAFLDAEGRFVEQRSLGPLGVAVPGTPRGLFALHERCGKLPFEAVVAPAIGLARAGFRVDPWLALDLQEEQELLRAGGAMVFFAGNRPLAEGELLRQEALARTLERYARIGPDAFYRGEVAASTEDAVRSRGGVLGLEDLAGYEVRWREPLRGWFRGLEIVTVPPPSSGGILLLQVLSMLDGFPLDEERQSTLRAEGEGLISSAEGLSERAVHWWIEALRLAFADRAAHLGDPDFVAVPIDALLSPDWIAERRTSIGELAHPSVVPMPDPVSGPAPEQPTPEGDQTTHVSVLDGAGNAVSLTTTLNTTFGSGIYTSAGFLLNDEIDDFSIQAGAPNVYHLVGGRANALAPGKRPLSSMTPVVVRDAGAVVRLILGSPGGPRIVSSVIEVILRTEVYGQSLEAAVAAPRVHQQWSPSSTVFEPGWDPLLLQALTNRDHEIVVEAEPWSSVQAIQVEIGGEPIGASDPRGGGTACAVGRTPSTPARPAPAAPAAPAER